MINSENINILSASLIINELCKCNINYFFISPGSRSTPLTLAIAELAEQTKIGVMICPDERAAAYACLGYSKTGKVGALVCTSGTAVANYLPAIIEAHNSQVPMIVLTADRPAELKDTQSNQTIDQNQIFGKYVNYYAEIDCADRYLKLEYLLTTIDNAVYKASGINLGAVHINCCFREPFFEPMEYLGTITDNINNRLDSDKPYTQYLKTKYGDSEEFHTILGLLNEAKKIVFVIGKLDTNNEAEAILRIAETINVPVFADILSQAKFSHQESIINHYDTFIEKIDSTLEADLIIHFGGRIVSKRLQKFIEQCVENNSAKYLVINNYTFRQDQAHIVNMRMTTDISLLCKWLTDRCFHTDLSIYRHKLSGLSAIASSEIKQFDNSTDAINEINLPNLVLASIPKGSNLYLGNSMPIRDFDSFASRPNSDEFTSINIGANRGASGIDGVMASAVGFGIGHHELTTLLIGDMSALHDLNSLHLVANSSQKMIIIIINNNGGGIFHFLPVSNHKDFEKYFATAIKVKFKAAAEMFGLNYSKPHTKQEFTNEYQNAINSEVSTIIEICTDRNENLKQHRELIQSIKMGTIEKCSK